MASKSAYFTVYQEKQGWRFMLWSTNGQPMMESSRSYSARAGAIRAAKAVMRCFPANSELVIYDAA